MTDPSPWIPVVDHVLVAFITIAVPTIVPTVVLWRRQTKVRDELRANQVTLRAQSQIEHRSNQAKLDGLAEQAAVVVTQQAAVASQLTDAIAENTAISSRAEAGAERAYTEANSVNTKIATLTEAQNVLRKDAASDRPHDQRAGDPK